MDLTLQGVVSIATVLVAVGAGWGGVRMGAKAENKRVTAIERKQHSQDNKLEDVQMEISAFREVIQGAGGLVNRVQDQADQLHEMRGDLSTVKTDVAVVRSIVEREMGRGSR